MSGKKFKTEIIGSALSHKGLYVGSINHVVKVQLLAVCGTIGKTLDFNFINNNLSQCVTVFLLFYLYLIFIKT